MTKHVLVFWTRTQRTSIVPEGSFVKSFGNDGEEIPIKEGAIRMVFIGERQFEAKILRICASRKYLESLFVTKEGEILLHGSKAPSTEILAARSKLQDEIAEEQNKEEVSLANADRPFSSTGPPKQSSDCSHGCPSCCSGTLPPFPELPDGFVSTLVSLAEYFQQFQRVTAEKAAPASHTDMSKNLNTWQWASREKVELKKGSGVWIDGMNLEKIMGHADITKKPPHQTLVKSLLLDLLGIDKYIETTAEKIDRRLISAVVGFANEKYPELAQPIERYYRCINLNRGYMQKRRNEGAFDDDDCGEGTTRKMRKASKRQATEESAPYSGDLRQRRNRKSSGVNRDTRPLMENNFLNNFEDMYSDQLIIPLDSDEDIPALTTTNTGINKILVVPNNSSKSPILNVDSSQKSKGQRRSQPTVVTVEDSHLFDENTIPNVDTVQIKTEDDLGHIEGALDFDL